MRKENTATPPAYIYIFVFVNEVFNIVTRVSLSPYIPGIYLIHYATIYTLGIFPHLSAQNVWTARPRYNKNGRLGRQKISAIDATHHCLPAP